MNSAQLIEELLEMAKNNEWQTRHAAENPYCPYCANDDDQWGDQKEHHAGCKFLETTIAAEIYLRRVKEEAKDE